LRIEVQVFVNSAGLVQQNNQQVLRQQWLLYIWALEQFNTE
jgi:hypothetical protein